MNVLQTASNQKTIRVALKVLAGAEKPGKPDDEPEEEEVVEEEPTGPPRVERVNGTWFRQRIGGTVYTNEPTDPPAYTTARQQAVVAASLRAPSTCYVLKDTKMTIEALMREYGPVGFKGEVYSSVRVMHKSWVAPVDKAYGLVLCRRKVGSRMMRSLVMIKNKKN